MFDWSAVKFYIGILGAISTIVVVGTNAAFMLIWPRAWFRLPNWIRFNGTLSEQKYATGWPSLELRLGGAIVLFAIVWVVLHIILNGQ